MGGGVNQKKFKRQSKKMHEAYVDFISNFSSTRNTFMKK